MHERTHIVVIACSFLLASCGFGDGLDIARANRLFRNGYAHESVALYLEAGAGQEAVASYNLANVFLSLSEKKPAMAMFETAIATGDTGLVARAWFNIGVSAFESAEYPQAMEAFRKALEAYADDPVMLSARGAKHDVPFRFECSRAYELALAMASKRQETGAVERGAFGSGSSGDDPEPFTLSRTGEQTLYAPGNASSGSGVDH